MTANITIVANDRNGWEGIYINGLLVDQDNVLYVSSVLNALKNRGVINYEEKQFSSDWLGAEGTLPELLVNVVFDE